MGRCMTANDTQLFSAPDIDPQKHVVFADEMQLLRWGETSTAGRTVTFRLPDHSVEHPFKRFDDKTTKKAGKTVGKRFRAVLVEINEGTPSEGVPAAGVEAQKVVFSDEMMLLHWGESSTSDRTATFKLPDYGVELHPFKRFPVKDGNGKAGGKKFMAVVVEINDDEMPVEHPVAAQVHKLHGAGKPFGKHAAVLYRSGWMLDVKVMEAAGSRDERDAWVSEEPCRLCGSIHEVQPMAPKEDRTGYYSIACCEQCADTARSMTDEVFYRKCVESLQEWASQAIARQIGYVSLGHVPPAILVEWAKDKNLAGSIPGNYMLSK